MNDGNKKRKKRKKSNIKWSRAIRWKAILFLYLPCILIFQAAFYYAVSDLRRSWKEIEKGRKYKKEYCEEKSRLFTVIGKHDRTNTEGNSGTGMMFLVKDVETGRTAVIENLETKTFMSYDEGDKVWFKVKKKILYSYEEQDKINGGYENCTIPVCSFIMFVALSFAALVGRNFTSNIDGLVSNSNDYDYWISPNINYEESELLDKVHNITDIIAYLIPTIQLLGLWSLSLIYLMSVG